MPVHKTKGIQCPYCKSLSSHTTNSRPHPFGRRRRYVCRNCNHRFTSVEIEVPKEYLRLKSVKELAKLIISRE